MDRVDEAAERYLGKWNEQYSLVNDKEIVIWQVSGAMRDIEQWIEGRDPNGAKEMAGGATETACACRPSSSVYR